MTHSLVLRFQTSKSMLYVQFDNIYQSDKHGMTSFGSIALIYLTNYSCLFVEPKLSSNMFHDLLEGATYIENQ